MNRIVAISGTALFLAAVLIIFFEEGYIRFNYPSKEKYPVRGIDISHHQTEIDWEILARANLGALSLLSLDRSLREGAEALGFEVRPTG